MSLFPSERHALAGGGLRPLESDDLGPLADFLAAMDPWVSLGFKAEALERWLGRDDPALARYVLERDKDSRAGLLAVRHPWLRGPYIELLAVFPGHQGHGLGRALVDWAAARAATASANLWVCVSDFNAAARGFYAAQGFVEAAGLEDLVAPGRSELLLRKKLG